MNDDGDLAMSDPMAQGLRTRPVAMSAKQRNTDRRRSGMTMIEIMVAVAIVAVLVALGTPALQQFVDNQRVKSAARSVADAFQLARSEAIRTGNSHIVFLSAAAAGNPEATDPVGTSLNGSSIGADPRGGVWPVLIVDDGAPGAWNCRIDAADPGRGIPPEPGVSWGVTRAVGVRAPGDGSLADPATGSTFEYRGGRVTWVMFRADGIPLTFDAACNLGTIGSGGGAVYVTNGSRDYAVVLSPLGAVRVHAFEAGAGRWTE
jgi:prepilin-type N-terminal cleavage/methylation domain-containing protein